MRVIHRDSVSEDLQAQQEIYRLALDADKVALDNFFEAQRTNLVNFYASVGDRSCPLAIIGSTRITPTIIRLMHENKIHAAEFLFDHTYDRYLSCRMIESIAEIAIKAAEYGHRSLSEKLRLEKNAPINWIVAGAAKFSDQRYAEFLMTQGADILSAIRGAIDADKLSYADELQRRYLCENPFLENICDDWSDSMRRGSVSHAIVRTAQKIRLFRDAYNLSSCVAISCFDRRNHAALNLLIATMVSSNPQIYKIKLPGELLMLIFSFIFGFEGDPRVSKTAGFGLFLSRVGAQVIVKSKPPACCAIA